MWVNVDFLITTRELKSAEKSKLTSAFPEFVSESVDTSLEYCCEISQVFSFFNTWLMKACKILTFCLDIRKKRYSSLIAKFGRVLGN